MSAHEIELEAYGMDWVFEVEAESASHDCPASSDVTMKSAVWASKVDGGLDVPKDIAESVFQHYEDDLSARVLAEFREEVAA